MPAKWVATVGGPAGRGPVTGSWQVMMTWLPSGSWTRTVSWLRPFARSFHPTLPSRRPPPVMGDYKTNQLSASHRGVGIFNSN